MFKKKPLVLTKMFCYEGLHAVKCVQGRDTSVLFFMMSPLYHQCGYDGVYLRHKAPDSPIPTIYGIRQWLESNDNKIIAKHLKDNIYSV